MSAPAPPLSLGAYFPDRMEPQAPARVAVVMPTLMRASTVAAIEGVYAQDLADRIQIMIGADQNPGETDAIYAALERRPDHVSAAVLTLPYSTSRRHGGLHPAYDGGALRTFLSFAANARHIAYLDDDNVWKPEHLRLLLDAVEGNYWAHSLRMLIDEETGQELGVDIWDATGPNSGRFQDYGGLVDTNCMLVDKLQVAPFLWMWSDPGPKLNLLEADRRVSQALARLPCGRVEQATVSYRIRRDNILRIFMRDGVRF